MYDDAELDTTFSERARGAWVSRTAHSSSSNSLQPRPTDVRDGRRKTSVLVLTEELEGKIQTALALGCGHRSALQDVKKWKHGFVLKQADNTGSLEAIERRLSVKRLEIEPGKEPTELQKKTLEKLAQGIEQLKANRKVFEGQVATLDRDLARSLNRWRKAWTDVDKILLKVWRDAGQLIPDDNSDTDNEQPTKKSVLKDKEGRKRAQYSDNGLEDAPSASSELNPAQRRRAEKRQNDISGWRRSVESTSQGGNVDAHSPENRDKTKHASMHHNQSTRR